MLAPLVLLFIVVPLVELYVIIQVGQAIGAVPTILILLGDSLLGSVLLRSQGRVTWRRFTGALAEGRPPAREVLDGGLVILGGAFLLTPGFVTDVLGLVLLLPPTRAAVRGAIVRRFSRRFFIRVAARRGSPRAQAPTGASRSAGPPYDVDGTATDVDLERPRLP
jgi:UPF0716 protein FxsA